MTRRKLLAFIGLLPFMAKLSIAQQTDGEILSALTIDGPQHYRWTDNDTVLVKL